MRDLTVVVLAKEPRPGRVKTRLVPAWGVQGAADLARAALLDTMETVGELPCRRVLALDGAVGPWLTGASGWSVIPQRGDGQAARIAAACCEVGGPVLLIGMDTPQLAVDDLAAAADALRDHDSVVGPSTDGGWWLLGQQEPDPRALADVPMSTAQTCSAQVRALRLLGQRVALLHRLRDVDEPADVEAVAALVPRSRFARAARLLGSVPA